MSTGRLLLLMIAAAAARGQMDVVVAVETRGCSLSVDTVRFVWEVLPDQVFYPDSLGGPPGTVDSAVFAIPFLWFPPGVRVHYRINSSPTFCDTIECLVQDSWYVLRAGGGDEPRIRFGRQSGIGTEEAAGVTGSAAAPNPFRTGVRLSLLPGRVAALVIRDASGRTVRSLCQREAVWDGRDRYGRDVPPGAYLLCGAGIELRLVKLRD